MIGSLRMAYVCATNVRMCHLLRLLFPALLLASLNFHGAQGDCDIDCPDGGCPYHSVIDSVSKVAVSIPSWETASSPPISVVGFDNLDAWAPTSFSFVGTDGGVWKADAIAGDDQQVKIVIGDSADCALSTVDVVSSGRDRPYLQLLTQCEGTGTSSVLFEVPVSLAPSDAEATGLGLIEWMMAISPDLIADIVSSSTIEIPFLSEFTGKLVWQLMGPGLCTSTQGGVIPEPVLVSTADACRLQCSMAVWHAWAVSKGGGGNENTVHYCKGYAWSDSNSTCTLFTGWDVDGSDRDNSTGTLCYKTTHDDALEEQVHAETTLSWEKLLGGSLGKMFTARKLVVTPDATCSDKVDPFTWYTLTQPILLTTADWEVMNVTSVQLATKYSRQAGTESVALVMDQVCVRDMAGNMVEACEGEDNANYQDAYQCVESGQALPDCPVYNNTEEGLGLEAGIVEECFTNWIFLLVWLAILLLLLLLTSCCTWITIKVFCMRASGESERLELQEAIVTGPRSYGDRFRDAMGMGTES